MTYEIATIVEALQLYKEEFSSLYSWKSDLSRLVELQVISTPELDGLLQLPVFEKEIRVKKMVHYALHRFHKQDRVKFEDLSMWLIVDWGVIKAANREDTLPIIYNFIEKGEKPFSRIASYSKVASFMYPEECIIYDARVAYTLNWILLSRESGSQFFPMPLGRNSKMNAFDIEVLLRLKHKELYQIDSPLAMEKQFIANRDKQLYIPKDEAYNEMNQLIKAVHPELWEDGRTELYYTEMLLFSMADTFVTKEIVESVDVTFKPLNILKKNIKKLSTWGKRSAFEYTGSVHKGTTIYMGEHLSSKLEISKETYRQLLSEFEGMTVPIGTSRTSPAEGSLGEWIQQRTNKVGTTSFVGAILVAEGFAEKEGSEIRFL
ncbi:hypothetical protein [Flammeovirga sp. EKP202]|uniref:hypothetical protein n=1 Tax=Flammeovirga sp. EKP202 TaxID=2770592 RepID=UPI00165F8C88|nr:hypothetical protein [Flammeovirga sp. EKP202]MBD0405050.1 hypothetical protein [Flammeovirga sp. EKP202]